MRLLSPKNIVFGFFCVVTISEKTFELWRMCCVICDWTMKQTFFLPPIIYPDGLCGCYLLKTSFLACSVRNKHSICFVSVGTSPGCVAMSEGRCIKWRYHI